jgi:hypothetical protein
MEKKCFVIQRFDNGRYDRLYDEVFKPAIEEAGFTPYRVDRDPSASIPIDSIEREITTADACFVEISEDAPNVWFELGFSLAKDKPLCLVCSSARTRFPFDIQHRQVVTYPDHPTPSDYQELKDRIKARLITVVKRDVAVNQTAETARALSSVAQTNGLRAHELVALSILFESHFEGGTTPWVMKREMERAGYTAAASTLAVTGLRRAGYVEFVPTEDQNGNPYNVFSVAPKGEEWLIEHQDELNLEVQQSSVPAMGITDEDIPF